MRQLFNAAPFERVLAEPSAPLAGRWQTLVEGDLIAVPAGRADGPSCLSLSAAKAIIALLEGRDELRFARGSDPAFYVQTAPDEQGRREIIVYRTRNEQILSTGFITQPTIAAIPFAMRLLTQGDSDLGRAYAAALDAYAAEAADSILLPLIATASDELAVAIATDLNQEVMCWYFAAEVAAGDLEETEDADAYYTLDLVPLFGDPVLFAASLAGQAPGFEDLKSVPKP